MQKIAFIWASLFACLAVIDVAGVSLSRYGDIIAEQSGLSRGWVGLTQLATVTSLPKLVTGLSSVAAVAAGIWLPFIAKDLAAAMAWEQRFVGTLFVAVITSAPEVVVAVAALRIGAIDLACLPGSLLADVSLTHAASAFSAMMVSGLAGVGLVLRPASRVFHAVSWISLLLLAIYLLNTLFLYLHGD
jgi:cation:H+ antiporter